MVDETKMNENDVVTVRNLQDSSPNGTEIEVGEGNSNSPPPTVPESSGPPPDTCIVKQQGIAATNECTISGDKNKCPAGSEIEYMGEPRRTIDAYIKCPLSAVDQSDWVDVSQRGLCECDATLLDEYCDVLEEDINCDCFACPFGSTQGFAYECDKEITSVCSSFDCFGKCNYKYDPGNLAGDRETYPPTVLIYNTNNTGNPEGSSATTPIGGADHLFGTTIMVIALFKMVLF